MINETARCRRYGRGIPRAGHKARARRGHQDETGEPQQPWLETRFEEREPAISPDGRWIAYSGVILIGHTGEGRRDGELVAVLGFFEELDALVPDAR